MLVLLAFGCGEKSYENESLESLLGSMPAPIICDTLALNTRYPLNGLSYDGDSLTVQDTFAVGGLKSLADLLLLQKDLYVKFDVYDPTRAKKAATQIADFLKKKEVPEKRIFLYGADYNGDFQVLEDNAFFKKGTSLSSSDIEEIEDPKAKAVAKKLQQLVHVEFFLVPEIAFTMDDFIDSKTGAKKSIRFFEDDLYVTYEHKFFEPAILPTRMQNLERLLKFMQENGEACLKLVSHHEPQYGQMCVELGYNIKLAKALRYYLESNGIEKDRIGIVDYGSNKPYVVEVDSRYFKKGDVLNDSLRATLKSYESSREFSRLTRRVEVSLVDKKDISQETMGARTALEE